MRRSGFGGVPVLAAQVNTAILAALAFGYVRW